MDKSRRKFFKNAGKALLGIAFIGATAKPNAATHKRNVKSNADQLKCAEIKANYFQKQYEKLRTSRAKKFAKDIFKDLW